MSEDKSFDWTPIKYAGAFGATVAVVHRLNIGSMVASPISSSLGGVLGEYSGDVSRIVVFGLVYSVFDNYITPYLNQ